MKATAKKFGIEIRRLGSSNSFDLYKYQTPDGTFDYEKSNNIQIDGNKQKIENVWVKKKNIEFLADYISKNISSIMNGICIIEHTSGHSSRWMRQCPSGGLNIGFYPFIRLNYVANSVRNI